MMTLSFASLRWKTVPFAGLALMLFSAPRAFADEGVATSVQRPEVQLLRAAHAGDVAKVKELLGNPAVDVNWIGDESLEFPLGGRSALTLAIRERRSAVLHALFDHPGFDPNRADLSGTKPFCLIVSRDWPDVVRHLLELPQLDILTISAALHVAVDAMKVDNLKILLADSRIDPNFTDYRGYAPIQVAASRYVPGAVRALLDDPRVRRDMKDSTGKNLLMLASFSEWRFPTGPRLERQRETVIELLQEVDIRQSQLNDVTPDQETALILAAKTGSSGAISALLRISELEVNFQDKDGNTALMVAASMPNSESFEYLISDSRVRADHTNGYGLSALMKFAMGDIASKETTRKLLALPGHDFARGHPVIHDTTLMLADKGPWYKSGYREKILALLEHPEIRSSINVQGENGKTALIVYSNMHSADPIISLAPVVRKILGVPGIQANQADTIGNTALHHTFRYVAEDEIARALLADPEIDVNAKNHREETPLMVAVGMSDMAPNWIEQHLLAVESLLRDARLQVNLRDNLGRTALGRVLADPYHQQNIVNLLRRYGAQE